MSKNTDLLCKIIKIRADIEVLEGEWIKSDLAQMIPALQDLIATATQKLEALRGVQQAYLIQWCQWTRRHRLY